MPEPPAKPTPLQLFLGFLYIGGLAFGGAVAWARHVLIEDRRWLSEREYAELIGLAQVLPGPNVGNLAVIYGRRCAGLAGAAAALGGFVLVPTAVVLGLVALWQEFGQNPWVAAFMAGVAPAAAGLALGAAIKSGIRLRPPPEQILAIIAIALAVVIWRVPLLWVVAVAGPVCVALSVRRALRA
ncbi:MAG: chromate transporter [Rhodovarius sp.]|nr:chromate transporter [Rhodovarius sp.]MCX7932020.1 chromate transporter [Rhodovarius sp.]MDW8315000.1 chromate transporter [Rhodovarius sp.]